MYNPELIKKEQNDVTDSITQPKPENEGILKVYDVSADNLYLYYDLSEERLLVVKE
ncbi:MAG: hypothetical protein IJT72_05325 [Lachnospiraceae bacterium]|nr:hypothetical protein [Lachnospiraceae bacterium]